MLAQADGLTTLTAVAGIFATVVSAVVGYLGFRLSRRTQTVAAARQNGAVQGPYVDALGGWSKDIVEWWKERADEIEAEGEAKLASLRAEFERRLRETEQRFERELAEANRRADYWRARALGDPIPDDTTPPPDAKGT